ncbi:DUF1684 domain-containing protein [Sediminibacterium sp. TEGAF015]|uniref:DUF1684 domain-containing protein n=1 Tax=Sediminibacterium sp. TEGAF015 TaxID=575378 RepID=UPI002200E398|nr:DUF1684 domain-containing protein [Sediminibacterium sp. TEGAF015]BDQ11099.1 hypothetical protein TEGAF0_03160 [Sediminibacterium sp. TEGAF015]
MSKKLYYRMIGVMAMSFAFLWVSSQPLTEIKGNWRGAFPLYNGEEIPFNFSVQEDSSGKLSVYFLNGKELYYGGKLVKVKDSIQVWINQFDRVMVLGITKDKRWKGIWRRQSGEDAFPIYAEPNNEERFIWDNNTAPANLAGKYDVVFTNDSGKQVKAIGLFTQDKNTGGVTFLRPSGDSRYSYGRVQGNQFKFSLFIGYSPLMFMGSIEPDGSIKGVQQGLKTVQLIRAYKNEQARLPDPSTLTRLKDYTAPIQFSLMNAKGKKISLDDSAYFNKPVILTIGGTWCPNCADEAIFLSDWYKKNKQRGIEIITTQFEIVNNYAYAQKTMTRFKEKFDIEYEQVFGGESNGNSVLQTFPFLSNFTGFPTTLFIRSDRTIQNIHAGFSGPATGAYFQQFKDSFNHHVDALLQKSHADQIEDWKRARVRALKATDGWLNLEGLFWLEEGNNTVGADKKNAIVFPKTKISLQAGYFLRKGDSVWLVPDANTAFTINRKRITRKTLIFSNPGEAAIVSSGSLQFNIIKRSEKIGIRLRDLQSANLTRFKGINYFPTDSSWKIKAQFIKPAFKQNIIIKNALGQENPTELAGKIRFEYKGIFYTLDAISEGDYLLVVMGDNTSGNSTYAAGRFLYIPKTEAEKDDFHIDFNMAYNPPCVFTPFATCPIPPPQNILPFGVMAGEKMYEHH